jgi:glycosyltransferase involved in cell wall biosynthesis
MKFSVITVTFHDFIGLKKTLKSLAKFNKKKYEHIVIDGGSDNQTLGLIKKYSSRIDKWVSEPDEGIYDAMNKGLKFVSDENNHISFLHSGDPALPNYSNDVEKKFQENNLVDFCYAGLILVGKKKETKYLPKILSKKSEYLQRMAFPHPSLFIKKHIFLKIGYFDLNKQYTADHQWCVRLIRSDTKGIRLNKPVVKFKLGGASLKLRAQFEVFQTALQYNRNIIIAVIFLARQLISRFYYIYKSKC